MKKYLFILIVILFASCKQSDKEICENIILSDNWEVQEFDNVEQNGDIVSTMEYQTKGWLKTSIPATLMSVLAKNGEYKDILNGTNMKGIDKTPFKSPWWYRTEFKAPQSSIERNAFLSFEGLIYSADIWLNGELIASKDSVYGTFRQFTFDITPYLKERNILAVLVYPPLAGDPNIGFADWNPRPADENMGIFRPVKLTFTGDVKLEKSFVQSTVNTQTLTEAWLTIQTNLQNNSNNSISGKLVGELEEKSFSFPITLTPRENRLITLTSNEIEDLHIKKPRLWWCNNMGNPELYNLNLKFVIDDIVSSSENITFGIRQIETYLTANGHRGFKLNGKEVLLKGAGWTDDIFLRDTPERNEIQVQLVKDMNLNLIRFENFWGNSQSIYDLCDKYGLLALIGWSCHWEWDAYYGKPCDLEFGCIQTEEEINLIAESFKDQVLWLRNHPSIIAWMPGSDMLQRPELESKYIETLVQIDNNRPYVGAAKARTSTITGPTGTKMAGPYEYVGPNYWYIDTLYGGAFGFNTETGIGAQLPEIESIRRFISDDKLWPINNDVWNYHCTSSATALNSLSVLTEVMNAKYGKASDLNDYLMKANLINYDGTRAMFEAFRVNKPNTTGIVQWMLNSAWPSLYWQLYDYYLAPTAAYYATKKANEPIQLIYNYGDNAIYAINESVENINSHKAIINIYSIGSELLSKNEIEIPSLKSNVSQKIFSLPQTNQNTIVFLTLVDKKGEQIANNYYTISVKPDEYSWDKTTWVSTPIKAYNNYKDLSSISPVNLNHSVQINVKEETGIATISLDIENTSDKIAFFISAKILDENGYIMTPVFWNDNYISIQPNEKVQLSCEVKSSVITKDKLLKLQISGWNTEGKTIDIQ